MEIPNPLQQGEETVEAAIYEEGGYAALLKYRIVRLFQSCGGDSCCA